MIEIGAGGGSIASCNELRLLKVGPRSAGSSPGPVCYGRGGTDICVTDADLALGLIDAESFLGGDMVLDLAATRRRLAELAASLGVTPTEAAAGVYRVVGEMMAAATRTHALDRGLDYRGMPMLAFGGAGPLHACYVAELLGSTTVIVPPQASVLSAFGMLVTPVRYDLVRGALALLVDLDWDATARLFAEMIATGRQALSEAGVSDADIRMGFGGDFRYHGQANEVTVDFAENPLERRDAAVIRRTFEAAYEAQYGLRLADNDVEVVGWRLTCRGPSILRGATARLASEQSPPRGERRVSLAEGGQLHELYAVYSRNRLAAGQSVAGPALIEERETTTVILPGWTARMDETGCLLVQYRPPAERDAHRLAEHSTVAAL
jgi:N-methylhydantoinase A